MDPSEDCNCPDPHYTLHQLCKVILDKDSVLQVDRQMILLNTYLSTVGDCVRMADLCLLSRVLSFIVENEAHNKAYIRSLGMILEILKNPLVMAKRSDEDEYRHCLICFFSTLGCILLQNTIDEYKCKILDILSLTIKTSSPKCSNRIPPEACIKAIDISELVDCLSDFIVISSEDIYKETVHTILQICQNSKLSCWRLLMMNGIESLLVRLATIGIERRKEVFDSTYELLLTLFHCTHRREDWARVALPSKIAFSSLRQILRESGMGQPYINSLNVATIILKLLHLFPESEFGLSGLFEDILFFACLSEACDSDYPLKPYFKDTQYYFQMKKMMLGCISLSNRTCVETLKKCRVADYLSMELELCFEVPSTYTTTIYWSHEQRIELYFCTLNTVCALIDRIQDQIIDTGIVSSMLNFLTANLNLNDMLIAKVVNTTIEILLSLSYSRVSTAYVRQFLCDQGTTAVLLEVIHFILNSDSPLMIHTQSLISKCLIVLAALMENNANLQNEHAEQATLTVSCLCQRILQPHTNDSLLDNRLTVALANFLWEVLIWNKDNVLNFINEGAIFSLIDILEKSPPTVQLVLLSVLVDICQYHQSVPYLLSWRGPGGTKLLSILCSIWRQEEERLGVPRTKDKCILNIEQPLMGKCQLAAIMCTESSKIVSICDIYGSARPKIFAIAKLLHHHKEITELCEEHYRLGYYKLPLEDMVTMQLVEAYLTLKMGEVWWEIRYKMDRNVLGLDRHLVEILSNR